MENPSPRSLSRARAGILGAIVGLVVWAGVAAAQDLTAFLEPYRVALERGQVGTVRGAAFLEPRTPREAGASLPGVTVVVLPSSPRLLADLEAVKAGMRNSPQQYLGAVGEVRKIRDAYELTLVQAGAAGLILRAVTDADGRFALPGVPAGEWVLLGWHDVLHQKTARKIPLRDARGAFLLEPLPDGYRAVTYWLVKLRVGPGEEILVELHDRNPWLTGVAEEKTQGVLPKKTP